MSVSTGRTTGGIQPVCGAKPGSLLPAQSNRAEWHLELSREDQSLGGRKQAGGFIFIPFLFSLGLKVKQAFSLKKLFVS